MLLFLTQQRCLCCTVVVTSDYIRLFIFISWFIWMGRCTLMNMLNHVKKPDCNLMLISNPNPNPNSNFFNGAWALWAFHMSVILSDDIVIFISLTLNLLHIRSEIVEWKFRIRLKKNLSKRQNPIMFLLIGEVIGDPIFAMVLPVISDRMSRRKLCIPVL